MSTMNGEGVIKFNGEWIKDKALNDEWLKDLNIWRNKLYQAGLIGVNNEGVGYGNISKRFRKNTFIITGSGTGKLKNLTADHYTLVTGFDLDKNSLTTKGPIMASSESLTHAVIYECWGAVNSVLHIHHLELWKKLLDALPSTNEKVEYGTVAMALEMRRLFKEPGLEENKIFAMGGHEEGIISFGKDLTEAGLRIFAWLDDL